MFLGKTYQEFSPALINDSIVVVRGRVSMRDDGMNLHAVSMFTPDIGPSLGSGPLVISVPEQRATTDVIGGAQRRAHPARGRQRGATQAAQRRRRARVFEMPYPVTVSADLYGELKTLLGPDCLG